MFESVDELILGLITGIVFGFLLQKGQVAKYWRSADSGWAPMLSSGVIFVVFMFAF